MAVAGQRCLYCGAAFPADVVAAAEAREPVAAAALPGVDEPAPPDVMLIVLDLSAADPADVARALGISAYEAGQRVLRGGYQLQRVAPTGDATLEAGRLASLGLAVTLVSEAEARVASTPLVALGGGRAEGALDLRTSEGDVRVGWDDLLVVVRGPITREYQTAPDPQRLRIATLEPGYRFHLHRVSDARPVELDAFSFAFDATRSATEPSLLQLRSWVEALAAGAPVDDAFQRLTPVLGPAAPEEKGPAAALGRKARPAVVLDNLAQFRFYSAWRAAAERRKRSARG